MQTLREQLHEARETIKHRDEEIHTLNVKLEGATTDLSTTEVTLNQAVTNAKADTLTWKDKADLAEDKLRSIQAHATHFDQMKVEFKNEIQNHRDRILALQFEIEDKSDRIESMEAELQETMGLRQEVGVLLALIIMGSVFVGVGNHFSMFEDKIDNSWGVFFASVSLLFAKQVIKTETQH